MSSRLLLDFVLCSECFGACIRKLMVVNSGGKDVLAWPTKVDEDLASAQPLIVAAIEPHQGRKFGDPLLICPALLAHR